MNTEEKMETPTVPTASTVDDQTSSHDTFGVCPVCHKSDGCINIGKEHWMHCREHKIRWLVGANLSSSWQEETEEEQRKRYDEMDFGSYKTIPCM